MPALYAHNRFGQDVFSMLEGDVEEVVKNHYTQFRIGLQGPDIFFFHKPWKKNDVAKYGFHLHEISAKAFFETAAETAKRKGRTSREYAYVLGFICHFTLDSECHPYINKMVDELGVSHSRIESEFEKYLLRKDQRDPFTFPLETLIPTDDATIHAIHNVCPNIKTKEIKDSLETYKKIKRILYTPTKVKQSFVKNAMRVAGLYTDYAGLMHDFKDEAKCLETNNILNKKYQQALKIATDLIYNFDEVVQNKGTITQRFDRNYE